MAYILILIGEIHLADITRIIVYDLYVCPYQVLMYEYIYFSQKGTTNVYVFFKLKDICGDYLIL